MKKTFLYLIVAVILAASCKNSGNKSTKSDYKGSDCFKSKTYPKFAKGFSVKYHKNYKEVIVKNPWDTSSVAYNYILVQRGTAIPKNTSGKVVVEVPVKSVVPVFTPQIGFINELGCVNTIKGVSEIQYVKNENVRKRFDEGKIKNYGKAYSLDLEALIKLNPEIVIVSPFKNDKYSKLIESGVNVVCCASYMENTPLGRAEWLKFVSYFFNKEDKAEEIISNTERKYSELKKITSEISNKPTIASIEEFSGNWYVAGGQSYMSVFFNDAGGDYLWKSTPDRGSIVLDYEIILKKAHNVDFIRTGMSINSDAYSREDLISSQTKFENFKAVNNKNVLYCNTFKTPYYEEGIMEPHVILADFINILHPGLLSDHTNKYFKLIK